MAVRTVIKTESGRAVPLHEYISQYLDPQGIIQPTDDPWQLVKMLDMAFPPDCGVSPEEMSWYISRLSDTEQRT